MNTMNDDVVGLETASLQGDLSFNEFYRSEYRDVVGLAFALTGSRSASEELAQEAFTAAYRRWADIAGYNRPDAWVRRVLVNRSRSWGRRRGAEFRAMTRLRSRRERLAELPDPDHEFWDAVRALPRRQSQAITLHYLEDRPLSDIGEILECSEGSVKTHLHRGRQALADSLGLREANENDEGADR